MYQYFDISRGIIIHFADFNFAFIAGFDDGFYQFGCVRTKRNFANNQRFIINLAYLSPNFYRTTTFTFIVTTHIDRATGLKIGEKDKLLVEQMSNAGIE